jgi:hypothetical protein
MKSASFEADEPAQPGLEGIVLLVDVLAPEPVALLQAQRVVRAAADRRGAQRLARRPQRVPQLGAELGRRVDLPAELPT